MNLFPVILMLKIGCTPQDAIAELRIYQKRIDDERHHEIVRVTRLEDEFAEMRISLTRCLKEAEGLIDEAYGCKPSDVMNYDG